MKCKHGYDVDANGNHIIIPKKYEVVEHETGIKYEVTEHEHQKPEQKPEVKTKPVSFEQIKKLYDKEFPEPTITKPINEIKKPFKIERITELDKTTGCNYCCLCSHISKFKAYYEIKNEVVIQRYCSKHVPVL